MAADDGSTQENNWPLPKFYFLVSWESLSQPVTFQEVSGLDTEAQAIEYRHGDSDQFSVNHMPGIVKTGNVTIKKGMFVDDNTFRDWHNKIMMNTIHKENVMIQLLDESGNPTMTWTLSNAWPTKITGTDLKSDGNEVAVETIELAHEGLTILNG